MNSVKAVFRGFFCFLCFAVCAGGLFSQNRTASGSFARGETLFMENKPAEALEYLEAAARENPERARTFLYLGIAYSQLGRPDDAIAAYEKILPMAGDDRAAIAYNLGNAWFSKGGFAEAERYYSEAVKADPSFASAYLNRANALVGRGEIARAREDYKTYLSLESESPKREQVEKLIAVIGEDAARAEKPGAENGSVGKVEGAADESAASTNEREKLTSEVIRSLHSVSGDSMEVSTHFGGAF